MKLITLSEAQERLDEYARLCQDEPIIVTVDGVPQFQLTPMDDDDDFMNRLIATNAEFRDLVAQRNGETPVSIDDALQALPH